MASLLPERTNRTGAPVAPFDPNFAGGFGGYPEPPSEEDLNLRAIWAVLRRYWPLILGCVALAGALGWYRTDRMTPVYEAAASLRIAASESAVPGLEVLKGLGGQGSEVNTELEVLKSRAFADSVVARLGLRLNVVEPRRVAPSRPVASAPLAPTPDSVPIVIESSGSRVTVANPDSTNDRPARRHRRVGRDAGAGAQCRGVPSRRARLGRSSRRDAPSGSARVRGRVVSNIRGSVTTSIELASAAANALLGVFLEQRVATRRTGARSTVDFLRVQMDTLGIGSAARGHGEGVREQEQVVAIETGECVGRGWRNQGGAR